MIVKEFTYFSSPVGKFNQRSCKFLQNERVIFLSHLSELIKAIISFFYMKSHEVDLKLGPQKNRAGVWVFERVSFSEHEVQARDHLVAVGLLVLFKIQIFNNPFEC